MPSVLLRSAAALGLLALAAGCGTPYEHEPRYRPAEMDSAIAQANQTPPNAGTTPSPSPTGPSPEVLADTAAPLTLDDCLRLALANDRHLRIADRHVLIARDRVDEAVASVNPQVSLDGHYDIRSNDMGSKTGTRGFAFGRRDSGIASLNLLVPIYDFGGSAATKASLERSAEATGFTAVAQRQAVVYAVRLAYYRVLEARKIEAIVKDSLKVVDRQLAVAKDFFDNGLVARNDVLAAEVQKAERTDEVLQAHSNLELATATLNRMLGLALSRPTQVTDTTDAPAWTDSYEKTLGLAIDRRPELAGLRKQIEMAREEYIAARDRGQNPNIYAYGSYNASSDDTLLNQQWLAAGVGLKFPLFDGGVTYAHLQRKTKEIAELIDLHDEQIDDTVLEVKQAWLTLHTRQSQLPVARAAIRLAEENLAVVQDQYAQGVASSADVLTEEDRLSRARGTYSRALYGCNEAIAELLNAIGAPFPDDPNAPPLSKRDPAPPAESVAPATPPSSATVAPVASATPGPAPALVPTPAPIDPLLNDGAAPTKPAPVPEKPTHE
ncbi:MAG TPA: TolC family protein [Planctomycetota bacterium]|nr:TolC family protein [Planctomycetota bacterium]